MNRADIVAIIACALLVIVLAALVISDGRSDYNRATRDDDTVHFDPIVDHGHTTNWPTTDMPAESTAGLTEHETPALDLFRLALLQPDSELLPAEEA